MHVDIILIRNMHIKKPQEEIPQNVGNKNINRISKRSNRSRSTRLNQYIKNQNITAGNQRAYGGGVNTNYIANKQIKNQTLSTGNQRAYAGSVNTNYIATNVSDYIKEPDNSTKQNSSNPAYLNIKNLSVSTTTPQKSNMKVIVNKFHASSLLNSHEQDEKAKILTQNGLAKPSNAACEASFYAANYLTLPNGQPIPSMILLIDYCVQN